MSERDHTIAKLGAFLEVLEDLITETLEAGVSEAGLRRTLLAHAVYQFRTTPSDGIAALDHFRMALGRDLVPATVQSTG